MLLITNLSEEIEKSENVQKCLLELRKAKKQLTLARNKVLKDLLDIDSFEIGHNYIIINDCKVYDIKVDHYCNLFCTWDDLPKIETIPAFLTCVLNYFNAKSYHNRSGGHLLIRLFEQKHKKMSKDYLKKIINMGDNIPPEIDLQSNIGHRFRDWLLGDSYTRGGNLSRYLDWDYDHFRDGTEH